MKDMKTKFMPKTYLGKWSAWLMGVFFLLFGFVVLLSILGMVGGDAIADNLLFGISMVFAGVAVISSFVTGLISIIKKKERAILVYISTGIGFYFCFFLIGELLSVIGILPSH